MSHGKILFIDAYDSFSNNIITLLRSHLPVSVESIHIDDPRFVFNDDAFYAYLQPFDAVVAGPGPGHPENAADIGLIAKLWTAPDEHILPVLGICLGFQSLCLAFGASVERLREPRHGLVTPVTHRSEDVFGKTRRVLATQYHSLHVKLRHHESSGAHDESLWTPSETCPDLIPLAWDLGDAENGPILMSARHRRKPFWGVQYHPESICTGSEGHRLVTNWWREVCKWSDNGLTGITCTSMDIDNVHHSIPNSPLVAFTSDEGPAAVQWVSFPLPQSVDVSDIVRSLRSSNPHAPEPMLLESGTRGRTPVNAETGSCSIIGLPSIQSIHIRYSTLAQILTISTGSEILLSKNASISEVLQTLEDFVQAHRASGGPSSSPFWGGLIGVISYEAGLGTIDVPASSTSRGKPDVWFVYIQRTVVIDHVEGVLYCQSLLPQDDAWLSAVEKQILTAGTNTATTSSPAGTHSPLPSAKITSQPDKSTYCDKVRTCQSHLRAGSSYELCLTDQTHMLSHESSWPIYCRLRSQNPAPFGAYLELSSPFDPSTGIKVLSSSPERFLSWTREGECQFRPIKGTVKKGPGVTREDAEVILRSPKEQAENLMIVDLIRHDLSGVPGISNVHVPHLMSIEEYTTVYQLVSVVVGTLTPSASGLPVLAASLPPGSMTGAPKKRSCSLLTGIENQQPRGLYSGVLGYLDVGGGGDFSVVIRTAFQYADESVWRVGAGGAVTVLSEPEAEWEEMLAKRESLLKVFGVGEVQAS